MINRQLNEEETRIFAAGMAARRRGEVRPAEQLPPKAYGIWKQGWKRVGRTIYNGHSHKGSSRVEHGVHMIRTEVDDFDHALDIIAKQQTTHKAAESQRDRPTGWRQEARLANQRMKQREGRQKHKTALVSHAGSVSEMEMLLVERLVATINMLTWSVNEMSNLSVIHRFFPQINRIALIGIIEKLCKLLNRPMPDFSLGLVKPTPAIVRRCMGCDAELRKKDEWYCVNCLPPDQGIKAVSDRRRKYDIEIKSLSSEAKSLGDAIHGAEKAIKDAEKHLDDHGEECESGGADNGRHPGKNTRGVEKGRRAKNLDRRRPPTDRPSEDGPGNTEG